MMRKIDLGYACFGTEWNRDDASRTHPSNAREGKMEVPR
jgi:hypothetical protein